MTRDTKTGVPYRLDSDADALDVWHPSTSLAIERGRRRQMFDTGGAFNPLKLKRYDYLWTIAKGNFEFAPL